MFGFELHRAQGQEVTVPEWYTRGAAPTISGAQPGGGGGKRQRDRELPPLTRVRVLHGETQGLEVP